MNRSVFYRHVFPLLCLVGLFGLTIRSSLPKALSLPVKEHTKAYAALEEKPIVILVPSYNNEQYCEKNLRSILEQDYENFRVIYIDDCSQDHTMTRVLDCVESMGQAGRVTYIRNAENVRALRNVYDVIHTCNDHEIVVLVDGDDFLAHPNVLQKVNQAYSNPSTWMTYGQYVSYPSYNKGLGEAYMPCHVKRGKVRGDVRYLGHLKTFYAGLFKKIHVRDLLYEGQFFSTCYDMAIMMPMLEMAREHAYKINDILYLHNTETPIGDAKIHAVEQSYTEHYIRSLTPYKSLGYSPVHEDPLRQQTADVVVFSYNRPLQLYAFLESLFLNVRNYGKVAVLYRTSNPLFDEGYSAVQAAFPQVHFVDQGSISEFKPSLLKLVFEDLQEEHIAFSPDDVVIKEPIDIARCVSSLQKTGAYGYFLRLAPYIDMSYHTDEHQGTPPLLSINQGEYLWCFDKGQGDWRNPNSLDFTIFPKDYIVRPLKNTQYNSPNELEMFWMNGPKTNKLGLCAQRAAVINIPLNITTTVNNKNMELYSTEELLEKFLEGYKMDVFVLQGRKNRSAHCEVYPYFIPRLEN